MSPLDAGMLIAVGRVAGAAAMALAYEVTGRPGRRRPEADVAWREAGPRARHGVLVTELNHLETERLPKIVGGRPDPGLLHPELIGSNDVRLIELVTGLVAKVLQVGRGCESCRGEYDDWRSGSES
ncbi:hypothetical protein [Streptomyces millisiae]|uniref:Uncharacterized protein n=1 Tax=Streptomyces millisiae TaxID=3075542 RepID=A0ABU2LWD2_9ACTN|nr:hypothetical protein [Streptomyces sp. DSM 44918]MDT0321893.1 hypothetical protein [Streptomyces sp. DSM 44918]